MKKNLFLIIGGIVLIVSIFLISYYSLTFFNKRKPKVDLGTLEIVLSDEGNVKLNEQTPISDKDGSEIAPYIFKVTNKGNEKAKYQLLIEDFVSDASKEILNRQYLKYELKLDGVVIKTDKLSNVENNIIDERKINVSEEKKYELRVWIDETVDTSNWVGKTYDYNIKVNPILG